MFGNFVIGTSVLAPTGMLHELSTGLGVSIRQASLLVTFGAVVMCLGSPLLSWSTSRWDRRVLLVGSLALIAVAQAAAALSTSFAGQLGWRLAMLVAAAPFTPQAASVAGLLVPGERRPSAIAYVFLGWSLAAAFGMPLVATVASHVGWQWAYAGISGLAALAGVLLAWRLPAGLKTAPVQLSSWVELAQNPLVVLLLALTMLLTSGQFLIFTFIGPLLVRLAHATPNSVSLVFALTGLAGFVGNVIATRIVRGVGTYRTEQLSIAALALGAALFALSSGYLGWMVFGISVWGLGFASTNSMQQARLVGAAPLLAGAAVSLNTSALYIGQALGSALGGALFERGRDALMGYGALAFILAGTLVLVLTRPKVEPLALAQGA